MRARAPLLWLSSLLLYPLGTVAVERQLDKVTLDVFSKDGLCFLYIGKANFEKSMQPCKTYCEKQGSQDYGCPGVIPEKFDHSTIKLDDDGLQYIPNKCTCSFPLAHAILDVVIEGLQKLDHVMCAVFLQGAELVAEVGLNFVPEGGAAVRGAKMLIENAKTFSENGLGAGDFFQKWIGSACGVPNWKFDPGPVFDVLLGAPDSLGASKGCKLKNPAGCTKAVVKAKPSAKPPPSKASPPKSPPSKKPPEKSNPAPKSKTPGVIPPKSKKPIVKSTKGSGKGKRRSVKRMDLSSRRQGSLGEEEQ